MNDFILISSGAVLGGALNYFIPRAFIRLKRHQTYIARQRRRLLLNNREALNRWLVRYYQERGGYGDLFPCRIGDYEIAIPFLTRKAWQQSFSLQDRNDGVGYAETCTNEFPVNMKLVKFRESMGQRLFDEPSCFLDRIEENQNGLQIHLKPCRYFQVLTSLIQIEEETFRGLRNGNSRRAEFRGKYLPSLANLRLEQCAPRPVGCAVVLALKTSVSHDILIHTRSHSTATFGGAKGVIPNFGLAPIPHPKGIPSEYQGTLDIVRYNFLKEFLEELFNFEELIRAGSTSNVNPHWFLEHNEAANLLWLYQKKSLNLTQLGFGFDALNGGGVIALLATINDEDFAKGLRNRLKVNWEVAHGKDSQVDLDFVPITSAKLETWLRESQYHTGAAFAVSLAQQHLRHLEIQ